MVIISTSKEKTTDAAKQFLDVLHESQAQSNFIALHGDLGAGKTTFTQALAHELGIQENVTSPTFVIEKRYKLQKPLGQFETLIHIDAYRLEKNSELEALRFQETVVNPTNLIMLEWPERVEDIIPTNALHIKFTFIDEINRKIEW